jgi:hypothetical protein
MARPSRHLTNARQLAELGVAVPQVVAHRVARLALAGPLPNARDSAEFTGMVWEKQLAFSQAFVGMAAEAVRWNQQWALSWFGGPRPDVAQGVGAVFSKGLAPVHRKAVSNARRLSRTALR